MRHPVSKKWKDKSPFDNFGELNELEKLVHELEQYVNDNDKQSRLHIYVFLVETDPTTTQEINQENNKDRPHYDYSFKEKTETLVDVFDRNNEVLIVAQLPNAKKEDIELNKEADFLTIYVNKPQRTNFKTIELQSKVNIKKAKIICKNGVLQITLPKINKN